VRVCFMLSIPDSSRTLDQFDEAPSMVRDGYAVQRQALDVRADAPRAVA
jgi:hypothetical protein